MNESLVLPWRPVTPLDQYNGDIAQILASVDTLRAAWGESIADASPAEFEEARRRSLRRHAIETGIIERLYDVSWGITEALVAEGITAEVAAREGGLEGDALDTIRAQYDALEFLVGAVRDGRPLTAHFARELHAAICANQHTYDARDQFNRAIRVDLPRGSWKKVPNHVRRQDGSLLEYAPPEQVEQQMELLLKYYADSDNTHPVIRAAWLHHRFIQIHPFSDGNGRVARALTLLVLLQARMAPLVVDRDTRAAYIDALDQANDGDLRPLIRLFAKLEIVALRSELERPTTASPAGAGPVDVARASVQRLRSLELSATAEKKEEAEALADAVHDRVNEYLQETGAQLRAQFAEVDTNAWHSLDNAAPPDTKASYWTAQIIRTAREVDFFANLQLGTWWTRLHLTVLGQTLRFVACIQKVGHGESGVLALTMFAEVLSRSSAPDEPKPLPVVILKSKPTDSVTLVRGDNIDVRWTECCELLDRGLAAALANFVKDLG
jgi:Fic family protein